MYSSNFEKFRGEGFKFKDYQKSEGVRKCV